jgi:hypothetical protein
VSRTHDSAKKEEQNSSSFLSGGCNNGASKAPRKWDIIIFDPPPGYKTTVLAIALHRWGSARNHAAVKIALCNF